nr:MAG TPA: hypothetical protein [Caudoviricetes sp.]
MRFFWGEGWDKKFGGVARLRATFGLGGGRDRT